MGEFLTPTPFRFSRNQQLMQRCQLTIRANFTLDAHVFMIFILGSHSLVCRTFSRLLRAQRTSHSNISIAQGKCDRSIRAVILDNNYLIDFLLLSPQSFIDEKDELTLCTEVIWCPFEKKTKKQIKKRRAIALV